MTQKRLKIGIYRIVEHCGAIAVATTLYSRAPSFVTAEKSTICSAEQSIISVGASESSPSRGEEGSNSKKVALNWVRRLKIAIDAAKVVKHGSSSSSIDQAIKVGDLAQNETFGFLRLPHDISLFTTEKVHLIWKSYIRRPMVLVGPSLGAAVAINFAVNHSEVVKKLVLIDASVYAEGTGKMVGLRRAVAYAGARLLKSIPVRLYANFLAFNKITLSSSFDWMNVGHLHCLLPW
ncbi:hypothetical protein H6P81_012696 [Aristolochia fimbriata]|uniref:Serine aminopeptidase S33 domain-containing protein n=1 Tax=Aristolochia fimbriata TaxID=158543 RepID=A0AAV7EH63_ARIFI|nr:hypothetical protein H6P81_012696 [Aristolochia fimbriata]